MKHLTILLLLCVVLLAGCARISNEEIIEQCNYCMDNGYVCDYRYNSMGEVIRIDCLPPTPNQDD